MRFFCTPFFACNPQVDSIDKRQSNLTVIPINDLERYARSLEELLLDMNHLKDLPKALFRLQKLRRLGLSDNDIHRLPPDVGALHSLVDLNISRNDISDIPDEIKSCKQLLLLDISSNPIARLPDSITLMTTLTHLAINDTSLTRLPSDIGRLVGLRSLEVRENHLRNLPATITNLVRLQRLDLGQNELDELPLEIGALRSLIEFYLDENSIEMLPDSLLNCKSLEQFDISSNRLASLPDQFGELDRLTDLTLSHNCLDSLPNSMGRLKRVNIIKADDNNLTRLTPSIGSCTALTELFLMQNLLCELPSSIGLLTNLSNLNIDKNQIAAIPQLIGSCTALTVLSLRDNQVEELPLEIGKLSRLRVLDVANNRLSHLPYTINVLQSLQALWLSENQSQAMVKLTQSTDPKTKIRVLTCYLLPQQNSNLQDLSNSKSSNKNTEFVGGPKVHFGDVEAEENEEAQKLVGNFERKDTPHPKPGVQGSKLKKQLVDGHIIQHEDDRRPSVVSLSKKASTTEIPETLQRAPHNGPKSSLKHPPVYNKPNADDSSSSSFIASNVPQKEERSVGFKLPNTDHVPEVETPECGLKRINTPHYKRQRIAQMNQQQQQQQSPINSNVQRQLSGANKIQETRASTSSELAKDSNSNYGIKRIIIRREPNVGLGLSIAGGVESSIYYKNNDNGLFISKLTPSGPADRAGLRVGDKLLEVNGTTMVEQKHEVAVKCMQENTSAVELLIQRGLSPINVVQTPPKEANHLPAQEPQKQGPFVVSTLSSDQKTASIETISTTINLSEPGHQLGMSMLHTNEVNPNKSPLCIIYIAPDGPVRRDGILRVGDEVLSINGINLKGMRFDDALALLQNANGDGQHASELHLVVQRIHSSKSTRHQPKIPAYAGELPYGDRTLDGTIEEVELSRDSRGALGLSIVGGVDHACHPFAIFENPGVFVSKITANSPASRSQKLRVGDRILAVNGLDISKAKHADAVNALKSSGQTLRLNVCHEPQPKGLQEVFIKRRPGQNLGLTIVGGIGGTAANAADPTDEGIFVVEASNSAAEVPALKMGTRLLEVNDESLLGCTKNEAANILRATTGTVRLLICEGFNPDLAQSRDELQTEFSLGSSSMTLPSFSASASTLPHLNNPPSLAISANQSASDINFVTPTPTRPPTNNNKTTPTIFDNTIPLARSSPVTIQSKPAPPPRSNIELNPLSTPISLPTSITTFSTSKDSKNGVEPLVEPENLTFTSKLKHFENELNLRKSFNDKLTQLNTYTQNSNDNKAASLSPKLPPLVSDQDLKQIKENLAKTADLSTTSMGSQQQTRNIPIKIQSSSEQNGKSRRDPQLTSLHNEAYRIEPLADLRSSARNGDHYSKYVNLPSSTVLGLKSQDNLITGIQPSSASFEFVDAEK